MKISQSIKNIIFGEIAQAHCDGPCGVYDGASAEIAARASLSMTKKLLELEQPGAEADKQTILDYQHTVARYTFIKEQQTELAKKEILILWTDFFKPEHLKTFPELHDFIWNLAKVCSEVKQHVDLDKATQLHNDIQKLDEMHKQASS
jgi:nickel superoxide dismutase